MLSLPAVRRWFAALSVLLAVPLSAQVDRDPVSRDPVSRDLVSRDLGVRDPVHRDQRDRAGATRVLAGRVFDPEGQPLVGAIVHLVHRPAGPWWATEALVDRHRLETDDEGRFRCAAVAADRAYSAHATWRGADGVPRATFVRDGLLAGEFCEIRSSRSADGSLPLRVEVQGLEEWAELGAFRFRLWPDTASPVPFEVTGRDDEGLLVLPPLPGNRGRLEILDERGEVLFHERVAGDSVWEVVQGPARARVKVPGPRARRFLVVDDQTGEPVAGAELRQCVPEVRSPVWAYGAKRMRRVRGWRLLGRTDARGVLEASICGELQHMYTSDPVIRVSAAGRADAVLAWPSAKPHVDGLAAVVLDPETVQVRMAAARTLTGRLTWDGELPAAELELLVHVAGWFGPGGGSEWPAWSRVVRTDAQGGFTVPSVPSRAVSVRIEVRVDPEAVREQLGIAGSLPALLRPFGVGELPLEGDPRVTDLGPAAITGLRVVPLRVVDREGRPARGGSVEVVPLRDNDRVRVRSRTWLDARGRATLLLDPDDEVLLVVSSTRGGARIGTPESFVNGEVELRPFVRLYGRVMDAKGRPLEGAEVFFTASEQSSADRLTRDLSSILGQRLGTRADAAGGFRRWVAPVEGVRMQVRVRPRGAAAGRNVGVELDPLDPGSVIDLGDLVYR